MCYPAIRAMGSRSLSGATRVTRQCSTRTWAATASGSVPSPTEPRSWHRRVLETGVGSEAAPAQGAADHGHEVNGTERGEAGADHDGVEREEHGEPGNHTNHPDRAVGDDHLAPV